MRVIVFVIVLLAIAGVLAADGASMYGAHQNATAFSDRAAEQAVQTYKDSGGSEAAVQQVVEQMAADADMTVIDLSYHRGTTRWYEVTVETTGSSIVLKHLPYFKNHLAQGSTGIAHF